MAENTSKENKQNISSSVISAKTRNSILDLLDGQINDPKLSDVVFVFNFQKEQTSNADLETVHRIYAHKFILGIRSPGK